MEFVQWRIIKLKKIKVFNVYNRLANYFTLGGSVVIFIELCKMEMGKSGCGLELSHSLERHLHISIATHNLTISNVFMVLQGPHVTLHSLLPYDCSKLASHSDWIAGYIYCLCFTLSYSFILLIISKNYIQHIWAKWMNNLHIVCTNQVYY